MKIKRFFASEMREAIRQVKDELGPDAVILSNNKVDGGIELVAAIDYDEEAVHRTLSQEREQVPLKKKQRSVIAKIKKTKAAKATRAKPRLEDDIQDDVINFSHSQAKVSTPEAHNEHSSNSFADLLKQSGQQQSRQARAQSKSRSQSLANSSNNDSFEDNAAYTKQSITERRQPFISDFENYEDDVENNSELSSEEAYPFDYESLVKEEQRRAQDGADDFFNTSSQQRVTKTHKPQQKRGAQSNKPVKAKSTWVEDPALISMKEEIKSLRGILENQLSGLAWGSFSRSHPHQAELLSRLFRLGIKTSLSEKIVKQLKATEEDSLEDSWRRVLSIIACNIPVANDDLLDDGGIIALVGPTGVGKTTNIAKLAARFTLKYGAKNLALVTTDSYRVGAHEQLKTYGRILGVPVYVANDEDELKSVLSRLDDKQLVLVDTAGMSHRDLRLTQQLSMLRHSHASIKILAVLSASTQTLAMDDIIKTLDSRELDGCIASKVDESTSIGGIISILIENNLQLNYISDGQKVPEDIHQANTADLLKQALEMVRQHPVSVNTDELAMSFSSEGLARAVG